MRKVSSAGRVYLLCSMNTSYEQRLLKGIVAYAAGQEWRVRWGTPPIVDEVLTACAGLIVFALDTRALTRLRRNGLPVVSVSSRNLGAGFPSVVPDDAEIGAEGAAHFLERYYRSFAYVGPVGISFSAGRANGFRSALAGRECPCHWVDATLGEAASEQALRDFLKKLPPATGVFTASDVFARRVCEVAVASGLRVPEDFAVLGVDADELVAYLSPIQLSSVDSNPERVGYRAAEILGEMLSGKRARAAYPGDWVERIAPNGIHMGHSTDALATEDALVKRAAKIIRERACDGVNVAQLATACGCNRRTLEMRFRTITGTGIAEHLRSERIERAKKLLSTTSLTVNLIAERVGFGTAAHFSTAFKKATGYPPGSYRANTFSNG